MIRVLVSGAGGRMGRHIIPMVQRHPALTLAGAFDNADNAAVGQDVGLLCGLGKLGVEVRDSLAAVIDSGEVLIDFTFHTATLDFARQAARKGLAMVVGTTGLSEHEEAELAALAQSAFPCVHAANMAVGVNVLLKLVEKTSRLLGSDYDVEIIEAHHRLKKDAPSGTALALGKMAALGLGHNFQEVVVKERNGIIGARTDQEIGIQSIRGGDIVGEHSVYFAGAGERLELIHRAGSRDNFAHGAALAAAWIVGKSKGIHSMFEVLGLENI